MCTPGVVAAKRSRGIAMPRHSRVGNSSLEFSKSSLVGRNAPRFFEFCAARQRQTFLKRRTRLLPTEFQRGRSSFCNQLEIRRIYALLAFLSLEILDCSDLRSKGDTPQLCYFSIHFTFTVFDTLHSLFSLTLKYNCNV